MQEIFVREDATLPCSTSLCRRCSFNGNKGGVTYAKEQREASVEHMPGPNLLTIHLLTLIILQGNKQSSLLSNFPSFY